MTIKEYATKRIKGESEQKAFIQGAFFVIRKIRRIFTSEDDVVVILTEIMNKLKELEK